MLNHCAIRPPRAEDWPAVARMLIGIWPRERWLWEGIARGEKRYPFLHLLAMFAGEEVVGTVARFDLAVWTGGRVQPLAGIGSVATPEAYRGQGIAKRLLATLLATVDHDGQESALFTSLPKVYLGSGFIETPQHYWTLHAPQPLVERTPRVESLSQLNNDAIRRMARVCDGLYPNYDGKLHRDGDYWAWYQDSFNNTPFRHIVFAHEPSGNAGYVRLEEEKDRLLLSEFCCAADDDRTMDSLFLAACATAHDRGTPLLAFALPEQHYLFRWLEAHGIARQPEQDPPREVFMSRGVGGAPPSGPLQAMTWSLADKF